MRRPLVARKASRHCPLVQTGRADAASIESVPHVATIAEPTVASVRRPVALGTADARSRGPRFRCFPSLDFRGCSNAWHFPTIILKDQPAIINGTQQY